MRRSIIVLSALILSGCTALAIGGGGYRHGTYERPAGVAASDSAVTSSVRARLGADSVVSVFDIGVRTWEGTVTLSGRVGSILARNRAEALARETSGVKAVNNQIVVEDLK